MSSCFNKFEQLHANNKKGQKVFRHLGFALIFEQLFTTQEQNY